MCPILNKLRFNVIFWLRIWVELSDIRTIHSTTHYLLTKLKDILNLESNLLIFSKNCYAEWRYAKCHCAHISTYPMKYIARMKQLIPSLTPFFMRPNVIRELTTNVNKINANWKVQTRVKSRENFQNGAIINATVTKQSQLIFDLSFLFALR
jgi:hypothetical protein